MEKIMRKTLTYESAKNLKELELLEQMETLDNLDDEIAYLIAQKKALKKEVKAMQFKDKWKQHQMEMQTTNVRKRPLPVIKSNAYNSIKGQFKLGDLMKLSQMKTRSSRDINIKNQTPQKEELSLAESERKIKRFSLSTGKDFTREFGKEKTKDSEREIRWKQLGFIDEEDDARDLNETVKLYGSISQMTRTGE
jgi:hypothetical protein